MELKGYVYIKGFNKKYLINKEGKVYSEIRKRHLKEQVQEYKRYFLSKNGKVYQSLTHRILAEAFIKKPKSNEVLEINHKDRNKHNNSLNNLEWVTHGENVRHGINGYIIDKITKEYLIKLLTPLSNYNKYKKAKDIFRYINAKTVGIKLHRGMANVPGEYDIKEQDLKLINLIRKNGCNLRRAGDELGVSKQRVNQRIKKYKIKFVNQLTENGKVFFQWDIGNAKKTN